MVPQEEESYSCRRYSNPRYSNDDIAIVTTADSILKAVKRKHKRSRGTVEFWHPCVPTLSVVTSVVVIDKKKPDLQKYNYL